MKPNSCTHCTFTWQAAALTATRSTQKPTSYTHRHDAFGQFCIMETCFSAGSQNCRQENKESEKHSFLCKTGPQQLQSCIQAKHKYTALIQCECLCKSTNSWSVRWSFSASPTRHQVRCSKQDSLQLTQTSAPFLTVTGPVSCLSLYHSRHRPVRRLDLAHM